MLLVDVMPKVGELSKAVGTLACWSSAEDNFWFFEIFQRFYLDRYFTDEILIVMMSITDTGSLELC